MKLKRNVLILLLVIITFSCKDKDDNDATLITQPNISGQWEFILTPDVTVPDTTLVKGYTGADFEEYACINDEVFLYQDENGNIKGFAGPLKLSGKLDGKNISLHVFINPNGEYDPVRPLVEMERFSNMTLILDDFGLMAGGGTFEEYPEYPNIVNNTYKVEARMISSINKSGSFNNLYKNGLEVNHWWSFLCKGAWVVVCLIKMALVITYLGMKVPGNFILFLQPQYITHTNGIIVLPEVMVLKFL